MTGTWQSQAALPTLLGATLHIYLAPDAWTVHSVPGDPVRLPRFFQDEIGTRVETSPKRTEAYFALAPE